MRITIKKKTYHKLGERILLKTNQNVTIDQRKKIRNQ